MRRLSEEDEMGNSIFHNAHVFYRDVLKPGPQLDSLTIRFLHHLEKVLDEFIAKPPSDDISLFDWSRTMPGTASTNAMMGPVLLRHHADLLPDVWLIEKGFFFFIHRIPWIFVENNYGARDHVISVFMSYFMDNKNKEEGTPMIWDRVI